jgi:hypothetical protein
MLLELVCKFTRRKKPSRTVLVAASPRDWGRHSSLPHPSHWPRPPLPPTKLA